MAKQRAIVDTCFLHKVSMSGKYVENIRLIIDNTDYVPVIHPYVAEQEFGLHSYLKRMVDEGYIETIKYSEFITDKFSNTIYQTQYRDIYEEMRNYLQSKGGKKQMPGLNIPKGKTIFDHHISGSSMGDVHMILMASFLRLPIFLTEDSDIELLRDIAKRRLSLSSYKLQIYDTKDIMKQIAEKADIEMSHNEFEKLVKQVGEKENWSEINKVWHYSHE